MFKNLARRMDVQTFRSVFLRTWPGGYSAAALKF
jgi:hypothetical protein